MGPLRWRELTDLALDGRGGGATSPADLHQSVWKLLKPLPAPERSAVLERLAAWVGTDARARPSDRTVSLEASRVIDPGFIDVGAHSVSHASLPALSDPGIEDEVITSRKRCEEMAGESVTAFAYPFGDIDGRTVALVRRCGFEVAFTTVAGGVSLQQDRMQMPRFFVGNWGTEEFGRKLLHS
jgi:peptidoglycan/xylan/chitin deacetylase (PgdA/CDA1 family)